MIRFGGRASYVGCVVRTEEKFRYLLPIFFVVFGECDVPPFSPGVGWSAGPPILSMFRSLFLLFFFPCHSIRRGCRPSAAAACAPASLCLCSSLLFIRQYTHTLKCPTRGFPRCRSSILPRTRCAPLFYRCFAHFFCFSSFRATRYVGVAVHPLLLLVLLPPCASAPRYFSSANTHIR